MKVAEYFSKFGEDRIKDLVVVPPYETNKDKLNQWVRGYIKYRTSPDSYPQELVVTGPKMRVCFGGCKWNKIVFGVPKENDDFPDPAVKEFRAWLATIARKVKSTIFDSPEKFRPGSKSSSRFTFEEDLIKPSSDPDKYPDELRCRLSTVRREMTEAERQEHNDLLFDPTSDQTELVDADIFTVSDGIKVAVDPTTITPRSYMIPVVRISYSRQGDKFGLTLTITKGQYFANDTYQPRVQNSDWVLDYPDPVLPEAKKPKLDGASPPAAVQA